LAFNAELRHRLGHHGRERVQRLFTREVIGEQVADVYATVLSAR
jgi:hypothetical protein